MAGVLIAVFGFVVAWVLVRYQFPGKKIFDSLIDLPFALPTAVAGISLAALYAQNGFMGRLAAPLGIKIAYRILNNAVNEIPSQHLIDEKIRKLGWQTKLNFEKTIPSIFSWYRSYLKK